MLISKPTTSEHHRNKLINKLGIKKSANEQRALDYRRTEIRVMSEKLRLDEDDELFCNHQERMFTFPNSMNSKLHRKKTVTINTIVDVVPIPMRKDYSKRINNRLWFKRDDLYNMMIRNKIEFLAEGKNWHKVLEEENMFYCINTKEFIHPVHLSMHGTLAA